MHQAQEVMDSLSHHHSADRVNSCNRKLISNMIENEEKELTFKPKIQKKSQSISRGGRIEERLIEDAHKRKVRQNNRERQEKNKINELNNKLKSDKSNNYAYKLFEKDFNDALIRINK